MRKITLAFLFGTFMGLAAYASVERLYEWSETGILVVHRKMPVGPDVVTYSSDPPGFLLEFGLNIFLIAMGGFGVLAACREIILVVAGPESRLANLDIWRYAAPLPSLFAGLSVVFLLAVLLFGILQKFVSY